jgi:hypothetical protein
MSWWDWVCLGAGAEDDTAERQKIDQALEHFFALQANIVRLEATLASPPEGIAEAEIVRGEKKLVEWRAVERRATTYFKRHGVDVAAASNGPTARGEKLKGE